MYNVNDLFCTQGEAALLRSVILLPKFRNADIIQHIRQMHDPLCTCIAPHITLVFPFESEISTKELQSHIANALNGMEKFKTILQGITGDVRDGYLFLNIKQGNDEIIALHDRLYEGLLAPFHARKIPYCPLLIVGRLREKDAFEHTLDALASMHDRFETVIDKVHVERIGKDESSIIELVMYLQG